MTILFSNSGPKIPKQDIFGPKFRRFCFFTKVCNQTNLRVLISNMSIVFSNSSPKIRKSDVFGYNFKDFYFCTKLCNNAHSRALISNTTMVFQNCCPKQLIKASLVPKLKIFIFYQTLQLDKFEGFDFKYDNGFFEFQPENTQLKNFLI